MWLGGVSYLIDCVLLLAGGVLFVGIAVFCGFVGGAGLWCFAVGLFCVVQVAVVV